MRRAAHSDIKRAVTVLKQSAVLKARCSVEIVRRESDEAVVKADYEHIRNTSADSQIRHVDCR